MSLALRSHAGGGLSAWRGLPGQGGRLLPGLLSLPLYSLIHWQRPCFQIRSHCKFSSACEFEGVPQPSQHPILIPCSGPFVSPHDSPGAVIPVCTGPSSTPSGPPSPFSKAPALARPGLACRLLLPVPSLCPLLRLFLGYAEDPPGQQAFVPPVPVMQMPFLRHPMNAPQLGTSLTT